MILKSPRLTACPYCSSPLVSPGRKGQGGQWVVRCNSCGAEGPPAATREEAEAKWNRRPRFEAYREAVKASQEAREMDKLFNPEMQP
jgi:uncharacterized Zn finger protein (UPF0148 family)